MPVYYLVTLKRHSNKFTSIPELDEKLALVRSHTGQGAEYSDVVGYEPDVLKRMHAHTWCCTPNNISLSKTAANIKAVPGFGNYQVHFRRFPFKDFPVVFNYITKTRNPSIMEEKSYQHFFKRTLPRIV